MAQSGDSMQCEEDINEVKHVVFASQKESDEESTVVSRKKSDEILPQRVKRTKSAPSVAMRVPTSCQTSPQRPIITRSKENRASLLGSVFRCFFGCYCTKSSDRSSPEKIEDNEGTDREVFQAMQMIDEDLGKMKERDSKRKPQGRKRTRKLYNFVEQ